MVYKEKSDSELLSGQACWKRESKYFQQCKEQKLLKIYNVRNKTIAQKLIPKSFIVPVCSLSFPSTVWVSPLAQLAAISVHVRGLQCLWSALPSLWGGVHGSCDENCWEDRGCCALEYHGAKTVKSSAKPWLSQCPFYNERCLRLQAKKNIHSGEIDKLTN